MPATWDWLAIVGVSVISALTIELALWGTIYRHQSFQSLRVNLAKQGKKLEELKATQVPAAKAKSKAKKEQQLERAMRNDSAKEFASMKLKQTLANMLIIIAAYRVISAGFSGQVVAKLPFTPFSLLSRMTHSGLDKSIDLTACSWTFIFTLCQMGVRANISKALDLGPTRQMLGLTSLSSMSDRGADVMAGKVK